MIKKIKAFINKVIEEYMVESLCKTVRESVESITTSKLKCEYYKSTNVYHIDFENKIRRDGGELIIRKSINIATFHLPFLDDDEILMLCNKLIGEEGEFENESRT